MLVTYEYASLAMGVVGRYRRLSQRIALWLFFAARTGSGSAQPFLSAHARRCSRSTVGRMAFLRPCPSSCHCSPIASALFFPHPRLRQLRIASILPLFQGSLARLCLGVGFVEALRLQRSNIHVVVILAIRAGRIPRMR